MSFSKQNHIFHFKNKYLKRKNANANAKRKRISKGETAENYISMFNQIYENILHTYIYTHRQLNAKYEEYIEVQVYPHTIYANYNELYIILYMSIDVANYIECL